MSVILKNGAIIKPGGGASPTQRINWLPEFTLNSGTFYYPPDSDVSIGIPGQARFGIAYDTHRDTFYASVIHIDSGSAVNDIPASIVPGFLTPPILDPYFDYPVSEFIVGSGDDPFVKSTTGYTIGIAGSTGFSIAYDLDVNDYLTLIRHGVSNSIVNDIPSTTTIPGFLEPPLVDPYADSTGSEFIVGVGTDLFVRSTNGYSIGIAGSTGFAIAYDLDVNDYLLQVRHGLTSSIVNDIPSTGIVTW